MLASHRGYKFLNIVLTTMIHIVFISFKCMASIKTYTFTINVLSIILFLYFVRKIKQGQKISNKTRNQEILININALFLIYIHEK